MAEESWKPGGMQAVIPYYILSDGGASDFIAFVTHVLGAVEESREARPDGRVMHAQLRLHECAIMLGDAPDGKSPYRNSVYVYVPDVDAVYAKAMAAGAVSRQEPADQPYGDRGAGFEDRWGNVWWVGTKL